MKSEWLLQEEIERVLGLLMPDNALACRVSLETGLRISDVLSLRAEQLKKQMWISEQKTGKRRRVNFRADTFERLVRNGRIWPGRWCFPGRNPIYHRTRQAVWKDLKRASKAYRLPQNVSVHSMRKCYAVKLYEQAGLEKVQKALCHSDAAVTMIYALAALEYDRKYVQKVTPTPRIAAKRRAHKKNC